MTDTKPESSQFSMAFKLNEAKVLTAFFHSIHYFGESFVIVAHGDKI